MDNLIARAWKNYRVLQKGPESLESICEDVLSLTAKLRLVDETRVRGQLSTLDQQTLDGIIDGCNSVLMELEGLLSRCRANHGTLEIITDVQREVLEQENDLTTLLETLRSHTQEKVLRIFDQIREIKSGEFQRSMVTDWEVLKAELEKLGLPQDLIEEEFFFIENWLKENYPIEAPEEEQDDEALPGYAPGAQKGTIEEKVQDLQQTTMVMRESAVQPVASSSKAEPPPYTFEAGADEESDDTFSVYINAAIRTEAEIRASQRLDDTELGAYPWSWLPSAQRTQFSKLEGVEPRLPPESFSIMAYETCPRLTGEIERLKRLVKAAFASNSEVQGSVQQETLESLKVMLNATHKFSVLQDQGLTLSRTSDLDVVDYEVSTAMAANLAVGALPTEELELAQKGYYRLLTYVMGFINAFASIYTGRTYVTNSPSEIDFAWKALKMSTRTAWVEKQLAAWELIQNAAFSCRDFYRHNPSLQSQAIKALQDWSLAEKIISGRDQETIRLTLISGTAFPKSSLRAPNSWVKIVFYGQNSFGSAIRKHEFKSEVAHKTQDPVWNQAFKLDVPRDARMLDLEIFDRVGGMNVQLGRIRLKFSSVPGIDASFAGRSLIYGLDEVFDYPLDLGKGKGKEKAVSTLKIGLRWQGRQGRVAAMGLPIRPPGKMFRPDLGIVPWADGGMVSRASSSRAPVPAAEMGL